MNKSRVVTTILGATITAATFAVVPAAPSSAASWQYSYTVETGKTAADCRADRAAWTPISSNYRRDPAGCYEFDLGKWGFNVQRFH
jgi:hypothetical protein